MRGRNVFTPHTDNNCQFCLIIHTPGLGRIDDHITMPDNSRRRFQEDNRTTGQFHIKFPGMVDVIQSHTYDLARGHRGQYFQFIQGISITIQPPFHDNSVTFYSAGKYLII